MLDLVGKIFLYLAIACMFAFLIVHGTLLIQQCKDPKLGMGIASFVFACWLLFLARSVDEGK